jgi:hypothetical protein
MSKRIDREDRILENLRSELRIVKSENRQLRKRLKKLSRGYNKFLDESEEVQEAAVEEAKEIAKKICWDCNIGNYELIIIGNRRFRKCSECGKRGKVSII